MNKDQVLIELRVYVARCFRTKTAAAAHWSVSPQFITMVLGGKKSPTVAMLRDCGYEAVTTKTTTYRKIKKSAPPAGGL